MSKIKMLAIGLITLIAISTLVYFVLNKKADPNNTDGGLVQLMDIPNLIKSLQSTGTNGSFWVVLIPKTALDDGLDANLQFSIENNTIGMDWNLNCQRNIQDQEKFVSALNAMNIKYSIDTENDMELIRAQNCDDWNKISYKILHDIYGVQSQQKMKLIITGFEWNKND